MTTLPPEKSDTAQPADSKDAFPDKSNACAGAEQPNLSNSVTLETLEDTGMLEDLEILEGMDRAETLVGVDGLENEPDSQEKAAVAEEINALRKFVGNLKMDDIKGGQWFEKLLAHSLGTYTTKVDAQYFRDKYPNLPADAVVDARIQMAARYAAIEGGLSSAAYSSAIAATIGSGGGASPLTLPAGGAAFVIDMSYLAQAQMKLAWDISVLYNVPIDVEDPSDLWKLIRIAFVVKAAESGGGLLLKGAPAFVRSLLKRYYSKGVLAAARTLPVVGKYLLQRNVIKFAIPGVSIPATILVNAWSTKIAGRNAREVLRTEAAIIEQAREIVANSEHHEELLHAMWAVASANGKSSENQRILLHHVSERAQENGLPEDALAEFRNVVQFSHDKLKAALEALPNAEPIYSAAMDVAEYGRVTVKVKDVLRMIADATSAQYREPNLQPLGAEQGNPAVAFPETDVKPRAAHNPDSEKVEAHPQPGKVKAVGMAALKHLRKTKTASATDRDASEETGE